MADKNWQAGGEIFDSGAGVVCVAATAAPCGSAWGAPQSGDFAPASYVGALDPDMIWELLIGGIVIFAFLSAIGLWMLLGAAQGQGRASCAETHSSAPP